MRRLLVCAAAVVCCAFSATAELTWTGGGGDLLWSNGANWDLGDPPGNPTPDGVTFGAAGSAEEEGTLTSVLDPQNLPGAGGDTLDTWTVGSLLVDAPDLFHAMRLYDDAGPAAKTLVVESELAVEQGYLGLVDGSLGLGTDATAADLAIGGTLVWPPGQNRPAVLDLTSAQIAGGVLKVGDLLISGGHDTTKSAELRVSDATGLTKVEVVNALRMAVGNGERLARFGDPANDWKLPANIDIEVGTEAEPGVILLSTEGGYWSNEANLVASGGGTFTAYLSELMAGTWQGQRQEWNFPYHIGVLDLAAMNDCTLQVDVVKIGTVTNCPPAGQNEGKEEVSGEVILPEGTAVVNSLEVGFTHPVPMAPASHGLLRLDGTVFRINTDAAIHATGTVETNVSGFSCGLDLAGDAAFVVDEGGAININFLAEQDPGETGEYWGLRWEGDHRADLASLEVAGLLTINDAAVSGTGGIAYDADNDVTYVCIRDTWPPEAIARDLTVEILPPAIATVVVSADEVDARAGDPDIVSRRISNPFDTDTDPETVTLTATEPGTFDILLTITDTEGQEASDTGTLSLVLTPPAVEDALIWSGAAGTPLMDRPQWALGGNWAGGAPPANPTPATLTFALDGGAEAAGTVTALLDPQDQPGASGETLDAWTVGGLFVDAHNVFHTVRLYDPAAEAAKTLIVENGIEVAEGCLALVDGSLGLGSDTTVANLHIGRTTWPQNTVNAVLDLTSAQVAGGILSVGELWISGGANTATCELRLSDATGLSKIQVGSVLRMAVGNNRRVARMGDPDNDWKLPPDIDIEIGTEETPATVLLASDGGWWETDAHLVASGGGTFTANLSLLRVSEWASSGALNAAYTNGTLDLSAMDSCTVDVDVLKVGVLRNPGEHAANQELQGLVWLPKGTVSADSVELGNSYSTESSFGLLRLEGTLFTVNSDLTIERSGRIEATVQGTPAGLDLGADATLAVADGGLINVVFDAPEPGQSGVYWGLRWEGDHVAELQALADAGKVTWDDTASGGTAIIFGAGSYTYLGFNVLEGDANQDCVVNILDLIFVRNRLNQDVGTGDNWQADVNGDNKINILDLIFVRNRLNSRCPD